MTRPIKVNLKDPTTWPKGWKQFDEGRGWSGVEGPNENHQVLVSFYHLWNSTAILHESDHWLPMPPPPRSPKWRAK